MTEFPSGVGVVVTSLLLTWFVGSRIAAIWALRQKRKELDLAGADRLQRAFGEILAIAKRWEFHMSFRTMEARERYRVQMELLARASKLEADAEALLLSLASEHKLFDYERNDLGLLRQAFQSIRRAINAETTLQWMRAGHPQYETFTRVSARVASKLAGADWSKRPSSVMAEEAYARIIDPAHQKRWDEIGGVVQTSQLVRASVSAR